eukprot:CAMPEP_0174737210 /NCGR_PEP_ID=MMETSP1094-20130205/67973_1 /TAXON_ID=156173 /ORGANISM="Chrysochromulina brevifilum, Strain UTEX LB 985" /LENGTH=112 /DNA_ID=CAMNT_0015940403 /DNA_START=491 /DNA_END=829 /DNA_ORIENTATION=+
MAMMTSTTSSRASVPSDHNPYFHEVLGGGALGGNGGRAVVTLLSASCTVTLPSWLRSGMAAASTSCLVTLPSRFASMTACSRDDMRPSWLMSSFSFLLTSPSWSTSSAMCSL